METLLPNKRKGITNQSKQPTAKARRNQQKITHTQTNTPNPPPFKNTKTNLQNSTAGKMLCYIFVYGYVCVQRAM